MTSLISERLRELAFFLLRGCVNWLSQTTSDNLPTDLTATHRQKDGPTLRLREVPVAPNKWVEILLDSIFWL